MADKNSRSIKVLGHCRTVCFNTQRIHFTIGLQKAYIRDVTPVVTELSGGIDPEMDTFSEGFVIDVRPTVSFDDQWISMNFRGTLAKTGVLNKIDFPSPGGTYTGALSSKKIPPPEIKEKGKDDKNIHTEPDIDFSVKNPIMNVARFIRPPTQVQIPDIDVVRFRSDVRIPESGGVLFSAGSKDYHHLKNTARREVIMLVSVSIVK